MTYIKERDTIIKTIEDDYSRGEGKSQYKNLKCAFNAVYKRAFELGIMAERKRAILEEK